MGNWMVNRKAWMTMMPKAWMMVKLPSRKQLLKTRTVVLALFSQLLNSQQRFFPRSASNQKPPIMYKPMLFDQDVEDEVKTKKDEKLVVKNGLEDVGRRVWF